MNQTNQVSIYIENNEQLLVSPWGLTREIENDSFKVKLDFSPYNKRVSILDYEFIDSNGIKRFVEIIDELADKNDFGKVWGKVKENDVSYFLENGFVAEAVIYDYYGFSENGVICSRFYQNRNESKTVKENLLVLENVLSKAQDSSRTDIPDGYYFKIADHSDISNLAHLYSEVFPTYPYPVYNTDYLKSTLNHIVYGLIYNGEKLVAAASAEINYNCKSAEMTDFATLTSERGKGLASILLENLEATLPQKNIHCLYTIARSTSHGMNMVFSKQGYRYTGTLINNCNISGGFEDMNVWCKSTYSSRIS